MTELTVPNEAIEVEYSVGSTPSSGPFTIPFSFFQLGDVKIRIVYDDASPSDDFEHSSGATVTGTAVDGGYDGGTVDLDASVSNATVKVYRSTIIDRVANQPSSGPFDMDLLNTELNKYVAIMQELDAQKAKYISLPDSATDDTDFAASGRALCGLGESEDADCAATNRQVDASGPNAVVDDDAETAIGVSGQWQALAQVTGVVIQGTVTSTTKLFDLLTQYFCVLQNRGGSEASFRVRFRYTVECYSEISKEQNVSYLMKVPATSSIPFSFMDIEQDIDYFNGLGTLIVAIDIYPVGSNSDSLYAQWGNLSVTTSEPR